MTSGAAGIVITVPFPHLWSVSQEGTPAVLNSIPTPWRMSNTVVLRQSSLWNIWSVWAPAQHLCWACFYYRVLMRFVRKGSCQNKVYDFSLLGKNSQRDIAKEKTKLYSSHLIMVEREMRWGRNSPLLESVISVCHSCELASELSIFPIQEAFWAQPPQKALYFFALCKLKHCGLNQLRCKWCLLFWSYRYR